MRYYSSTAGAMSLTVGAGASDTTITVNTTVGLPASFPYTLVLEPGTAGQEEVVSVTAAAGSTLTVTRGEDGTTGVAHSLGVSVRHMMTARDLREAQEHEANTSAHGVTGDVVGTDDVQTLDNKTFEADADHTALAVRAAAGQTTPTFAVKSSSGANVWTAYTAEFGSDAVKLRAAGGAILYGEALEALPPSGVDGVVVNHASGSTGYAWKGQKAGVNKSTVDLDGNAVFAGALAVGGTIQSPTITTINSSLTTLTNADTALDSRLDAIEGNLGSQTTFAATSASKDGKRLHWGTATVAISSGKVTITHGAGFTPTVVIPMMHDLTTAQAVSVEAITATTFTAAVRFSDGTTPANGLSLTYAYLCLE